MGSAWNASQKLWTTGKKSCSDGQRLVINICRECLRCWRTSCVRLVRNRVQEMCSKWIGAMRKWACSKMQVRRESDSKIRHVGWAKLLTFQHFMSYVEGVEWHFNGFLIYFATSGSRPVTRAGEAPLEIFSPPLEKRVGHSLKKFGPAQKILCPLVSQTGYYYWPV